MNRLARPLAAHELRSWPPTLRYALAVALVAAFTLSRWALVPWLGATAPYDFAMVAIVVSTMLFGAGPGLLVVVLGDVAAELFVRRSSPAVGGITPWMRLGTALLLGTVVVTVLQAIRGLLRESRRNEARFRAMFEDHRSVMLLIEPETGAIEDANPAAQAFYGYSRDRLRGMHIQEINQLPAEQVAAQRRLANSNQQDLFVFPHRLADGTIRWVEARSCPMEHSGRRLLFSIIHDITERKRSEARLAGELEAMTRLQRLATASVREANLPALLGDVVDTAIAISGADFGSVQLLDPLSGDLHLVAQRGLTPEWLEIMDSIVKSDGIHGTALQNGQRIVVDDLQRSPNFTDGPLLKVQLDAGVRAVQSTPLMGRSGQPVGIFSTHYRNPGRPDDHAIRLLDILARQAADIIEHHQNEAELLASKERLDLAFRAARDGIWDWNLETDEVFYSPGWKAMLGFEEAEIEHHLGAWKRLIHPADEAETWKKVAAVKHGESAFELEFRMRHKDGHYVDVLSRGFPVRREADGPVVRIVGTHFELTERKRAEAALRAEQQRLSSIIFGSNAGTWEWNVQTGETMFNERWAEMVGYTLAELSPISIRTWLALVHPEDLPASERSLQGHFRGELDHYECEARLRHKQGHWVWVWDRGRVTSWTADGKPLWMQGTHIDISVRRRLEERIKATQEEKFRAIFDGASDGILMADMATGKFVLANASICRMSGYSAEELVTLGWDDFHPPRESGRLRAEFARTREAGAFTSAPDLPVRRKDGSVFAASIGFSSIDLDDRIFMVGFFRDITERKEAQRALVESEARYRLLLENLPLAVIAMDTSFRIVMANPTASALIKAADPGDLVGRSGWDFFPSRQDPASMARVADLARRGTVPPSERELRCVDGSVVMVETRSLELRGTDGERVGFLGIAEDVSDRKRASSEAAVREAIWRIFLEAESLETTYQRLAEELTKCLAFPIATVELYDSRREEMAFVGLSGMDGIPRGLRTPASQTLSGSVARNQRSFSDNRAEQHMGGVYASLRELGVRTFICAPFHVGGQVAGALVLADRRSRDDAAKWLRNLETIARTLSLEIARRQAQEALHASETRFRHYVETATDALVVCDATGRIVDVNRQACTNSGYSREELLERNVRDLVTRPLARRIAEILGASGPGASGILLGESVRRDGVIYPVETTYVAFELEGRTCYLASSRDISERVRGDQERTRLSSAIEQSGESIVITDAEARIVYVNPAFERATGYSKAEALGQTPRLLKSGHHDPAFYRDMWDALLTQGVWRGRFTNRHKEGRLFHEDTTISAIRDADGQVLNYVAAKRDVTREVQMEAHFRQSQKLEAVGHLAGGVAHDFNNILAAIMMNLELLEMNPRLDAETRDALKDLAGGAKRAATLTQQLLMFGRRSVLTPRALDLNGVVTNLLEMLSRLIGEHIGIRLECGTSLPSVKADAGLLEQVLLNLVVNARDAMPKGGTITIATSCTEVPAEDAQPGTGRRPGRFVRLTVADTGKGMEESTLKRIFEPFFTTKDVGKGSGLGLATVHGIVAQHHGWVEVESRLGHGSIFRVYLPASGEALPSIRPSESSAPLPGGRETILLVEDENRVRSIASRALRGLGYQVYEASNGPEAVRTWRSHAGEIDLLLTDMVMPEGMTGLELVQKLRESKPGLRAILSSGYNSDVTLNGGIPMTEVVYLPKPYSMQKLAQFVRNCLEQPPG